MSLMLVDFLLKHPEHMSAIPKELLLQILAKARAEQSQGSWLPESATSEMAAAVGTDLIQSIVSDNRKGSEPGWLPKPEPKPVERGSGWSKPAGLENSVPGIRIIDQLCDVQDLVDRKEREGKFKRRI